MSGSTPQQRTTNDWLAHYRIVIIAMFTSFALHGALVFAGSYRGTYDAFVHIFFADHYRRDWWSLWEPRWYTGFTMASYPPLTHQLTALLSNLFSLPTAFSIVILVSTVVTTLGVYRFSRLWVNHRAASYAAVLATFSSSIAETVHVFGQLPTIFVMGVLLNALPFVWRWLEDGQAQDLLRGWALVMVAAAGHHVTTLFGMFFFAGPIFATVLLQKFRTPRTDEPDIADDTSRLGLGTLRQLAIRRMKRVFPGVIRSGVFGVGMVMIIVLTVLPYWIWSATDPITQISIPHGSRDSFLENRPVGFMFFVVPWGLLIFLLPYALYKGFTSQNWILASSLALLALLGTGGTTPIPAFLLRAAFYILTLDRFTFWATIVILPFAGQFIESLLHGHIHDWIQRYFGGWVYASLVGGLATLFVGFTLFTANLTQFRKFQPDPIDMTPIVEFLAKDNHDRWRYMTLGFGDQMAWLSANTTALNVEGNYHSARRLPEMTSTPVERLDGAKFTSIPGLGSLQQFLTNPQRYNLKYIFENDAFYEPLLYFSGWHKLVRLDNDIEVWERADVPPLPTAVPAQDYPDWQRLMWGALPVSSLFIAIGVFSLTALINLRWQWIPGVKRLQRRRIVQQWLLENPDSAAQLTKNEWQVWLRFQKRIPAIRLQPWQIRLFHGLLLILLLTAGLLVSRQFYQEERTSPEAIILRYYDALDFKRFNESYDYLHTDLTRDEYLRGLSTQGGLVASFSKLNNLAIELTEIDGETQQANIELEWVTALGEYVVYESFLMHNTSEGWRIGYTNEPLPTPRETFVSTAQPQFAFDLRLQPLEDGALTRGDLSRSLLSVSQPRLVYSPTLPIGFRPDEDGPDAGRLEENRYRGLLSVVGYVANRDSYPAHITVTAILRDAAGERLAQTNAMDMILHQLLPGESTPFRVDFAGAQATELTDLSQIANVEVIVQGVPTVYNLERPLIVQELGILYNAGAKIIDVPRVLTTFYSRDGSLIWVDGVYLEASIGVDDTGQYTLPTLPEGLIVLPLPVQVDGPRLEVWQPDFISQRLWVNGFSQ